MRSIVALGLFCAAICSSQAGAQGTGWGKWTLQPHISLGKLLPGSTLTHGYVDFFRPDGQFYAHSTMEFHYVGTSVGFGFRAFPDASPWLAVLVGGGITWFGRPGSDPIVATAPNAGVGTQLAPADFTVYPLTLGLQVTYPSKSARDFMLFAGAEGTANFVSGNIPMNQSVKAGLGLTAGFAVKAFELGMRYQTFSDMRNLGVYLAVRLSPFEVDFSGDDAGR